MQTVTVFVIALFLFVGFTKIKMKNRRAINIISSAMFGVYLIHDNPYMREFLWKHLFDGKVYAKSAKLIPYSLGVVMIVFVCCTIAELIRIYTIEKGTMLLYDKMAASVKERYMRRNHKKL